MAGNWEPEQRGLVPSPGSSGPTSPAPSPVQASPESGLSDLQVLWSTFYLEAHNPDDATKRFNAAFPALKVTKEQVALWWKDPEFKDFMHGSQHNRRRWFERIRPVFYPKVYRALSTLLEHEDWKAVAKGVELFARIEGLLIDKAKEDQSGTVAQLVSMLRQTQQVQVVRVLSPHQVVEGEAREIRRLELTGASEDGD